MGGLSADAIFGKSGALEAGLGHRNLGAGLNFNGAGDVVGGAVHLGITWPQSIMYLSVPLAK